MSAGLENLLEKVRNVFFEISELDESPELRSHALAVTALLLVPPLSDGRGGFGH